MSEVDWNSESMLRLTLVIGYGLCIAIVFVHASYNGQHVLIWTLVALIPGFGILF